MKLKTKYWIIAATTVCGGALAGVIVHHQLHQSATIETAKEAQADQQEKEEDSDLKKMANTTHFPEQNHPSKTTEEKLLENPAKDPNGEQIAVFQNQRKIFDAANKEILQVTEEILQDPKIYDQYSEFFERFRQYGNLSHTSWSPAGKKSTPAAKLSTENRSITLELSEAEFSFENEEDSTHLLKQLYGEFLQFHNEFMQTYQNDSLLPGEKHQRLMKLEINRTFAYARFLVEILRLDNLQTQDNYWENEIDKLIRITEDTFDRLSQVDDEIATINENEQALAEQQEIVRGLRQSRNNQIATEYSFLRKVAANITTRADTDKVHYLDESIAEMRQTLSETQQRIAEQQEIFDENQRRIAENVLITQKEIRAVEQNPYYSSLEEFFEQAVVRSTMQHAVFDEERSEIVTVTRFLSGQDYQFVKEAFGEELLPRESYLIDYENLIEEGELLPNDRAEDE